MNDLPDIAPSFQMSLIAEIEQKIWEHYKSYKTVKQYILKFRKEYWNGQFLNDVSFEIIENKEDKIDLNATLHNIDGQTLLQIAIDLGIETPDFIPMFPTFKNVVKENKNLKQIFDNAFKNVEADPALSIANSNAALESLTKSILKRHDEKSYNQKDTLEKLVEKVLKLFNKHPHAKQDADIRRIGSGLMNVAGAIEKIRSSKTSAHGKSEDEYLIEEPLYAYFIINAVATVGLYIDSFYKRKFLVSNGHVDSIDYPEGEIDPNDIPF